MSETKINTKSVLLGIFITVFTGILVSQVNNYLITKNPNLIYTIFDSPPFSGDEEIIGIYNVYIANEGKSMAKNIKCFLELEKAIIDDYRISIDPAVSYEIDVTPVSITLDLPTLNPSESFQLSILASSQDEYFEDLQVSLRAEGYNGKEKPISNNQNQLFANTMAILGGLLSTIGSYYLVSDIKRRKKQEENV